MATMNPLQESACNAGDIGSIPGSGRSLGGGKWQITPVFLPGQRKKSNGQRSLVGYSPKGLNESDMTEQLSKLVSYYGEMLSVLAVFSSTPSSPKFLFFALFLRGRLPRWATQTEPLCHWPVVRCSQGWDQPEMAAEGAGVSLVSYLWATLTGIWLHYPPPTFVLSALRVVKASHG